MISIEDDPSCERRRRFSRRPVELHANVRVAGRELPAVAANISPGGAFLRVELPDGASELEASIALPHGKDVRVKARVRWRSRNPQGVGVEFEQFLGRFDG